MVGELLCEVRACNWGCDLGKAANNGERGICSPKRLGISNQNRSSRTSKRRLKKKAPRKRSLPVRSLESWTRIYSGHD